MANKIIIPYNPKLKEYARILRKNSTLSEVLLWIQLKKRQLGVQFHRQVPILNFIVDFYCHELSLAIEVDGNIHEYSYIEDCERQQEIEKYGVTFIRFTNEEIKTQMPSVINKIKDMIKELQLANDENNE